MDSGNTAPATFNPQELNQALVCIICFGYFRNAHTVKECLHSFCKSCIYKHFGESMECPDCGKDLQPFPFSMIRPDPVLQTLVDKLFPESIEADYELELAFYTKRNKPLPEHLKSRLAARAADDLDQSIPPSSELDSELPSEPPSVNTSLMVPDNGPETKSEEPSAPIPNDVIGSIKADTRNDFEALDRKIEEVMANTSQTNETPSLTETTHPSTNQMDVS